MSAGAGDPAVLAVLGYTAAAAAVAALGALPFVFRDRVPLRRVGWAYALASGTMLGASYVLVLESLRGSVLPAVGGAGLGVTYTLWTHRYTGASDLQTSPQGGARGDGWTRFLLLGALHSASEGVAIGVAMAVDLRLGAFLALALAAHNIAESVVLTDVLRRAGSSLPHAAGLCVTAKVPQVLLAVVAYSVTAAAAPLTPWVLSFAAGAMVYLVLTELLPASYERAGRTPVALLVSASAGGVVLVEVWFV